MSRKPLPSIELVATDKLLDLSKEVEQNLNDLVIALNTPLDGKGKRVQHVARGIADTDGVNVGQLRDAVGRGAPGRAVRITAPGVPTFNGAVHEYGLFTVEDLVLPSRPFNLHVVTYSVDETNMSTVRGTLTATLDSTATTANIPGLTGVTAGEYILFHTPTQSGTSATTNDEIAFVTTATGSAYTFRRGRAGSTAVGHASSNKVFPIEIRHFAMPGNSNVGFEDPGVDFDDRFDMYLPARCVVSAGAFCSNDNGVSGMNFDFLPVFSTATTATPLAPGLRTLMGQAYFLPLSTATLATGTNMCPVHIKVQDLASIRTLYAYVDTAPTGTSIEIDVKIDTGSGYVDLETLTIAASGFTSYASGNEPKLRRMPYAINWADLTPLAQDAKLQFDINRVGSTIAGGKLIVVVQT